MLKKVFLGSVVVMVMAFTTVLPALAQIPEEEVKVEGTVQSIDFIAGTFTILTEDGMEFTVDAPGGFDLNLLVLGTKVEAEGLTGLDNMVTAFDIELHDGTEFEVEDESEDIDEVEDEAEDIDEVEDEAEDIDEVEDEAEGIDDAGEVEDEDDDDVEDDDDSGSDHEDDDDRSGSNSGSDHEDSDDEEDD